MIYISCTDQQDPTQNAEEKEKRSFRCHLKDLDIITIDTSFSKKLLLTPEKFMVATGMYLPRWTVSPRREEQSRVRSRLNGFHIARKTGPFMPTHHVCS
jgi:hypothetical protein